MFSNLFIKNTRYIPNKTFSLELIFFNDKWVITQIINSREHSCHIHLQYVNPIFGMSVTEKKVIDTQSLKYENFRNV